MAILLNHQHPEMRILNPANGEWIAFSGGKLEIDKDDPAYDVVMAEATRNPTIVVYESVTTCDQCGEAFTGKAAKAQLGKHRKDVHFDVWLAEKDLEQAEARNVEIVKRQGIACDVCRPPQVFPDADELAIHVSVVHTAAPELTDDGSDAGVGGTSIPAATPSGT